MKKKMMIIGVFSVILAGGGYCGYGYYQDYQKKEHARLIKERNEEIARRLERMREESIIKVKAERERKIQEAIEEKARQERIASGNPIIEEKIFYYPGDQQKKAHYTLVEGKKEGLEITWYPNGQKNVEKSYKNGKLHGNYRYWWSKGDLMSERNYVDGKLDGVSFTYSGNGKIYSETHYRQDKKHGLSRWADFYNEGETYYDNDQLDGESFLKDRDKNTFHEFYDKNKFLKSESRYATGEKRSLEVYLPEENIIQVTYWYKNGAVSLEGFRKQYSRQETIRAPAGTYQYYLPSGKKFLEIPYKNIYSDHGFKLGQCYRWNEEGELIAEIEIDDHKDWRISKNIIKGNKDDCDLNKAEKLMIFGNGFY